MSLKNLTVLFLLLLSGNAWAYYFTSTEYVDAYDGDTITVNIRSVHPLLGDHISIRVLGIDTPEIKGSTQCEKDKAILARDFVRERLSKAKQITLKDAQRGKYFRIVARVIYDGKDLAKELLDAKLAVPYDGGTKTIVDWCK